MSKELLSRRQLFRAAGVGAVGIIVAADLIGCSGDERVPVVVTRQVATPTPETPELKTYSGPIESLEGKPLIEEAKFASIVNALRNCSFPLFQMAADQLEALHYGTTNPLEFPAYISEDSTPIPITYDLSGRSSASSTISLKPDSPENIFFVETPGKKSRYRELEKITMGINLGTPSEMEKEGALSEGMYLTKELFSQALEIKIGEEFSQIINGAGVKFLDTQGNPVIDSSQEKWLATNLMWNEQFHMKSTTWKINDIVPVMIVAAGVGTLVARGELPSVSSSLGGFVDTVQLLDKNQELFREINDITNMWVRGGTFLPPDGIAMKINSTIIGPSAINLADQIYGN